MDFHFNIYSVLLLFGFMQGWVYAILLWVRGRREERLSDSLLGWVLVGCCFNIWVYMLGFGGIEILWRQLEFFPRNLGLLFPPLCYFYLRSQLNADFHFTRADFVHATPFLIETTYQLVVFSFGHDFVIQWERTVHDPYYIGDFFYAVGIGSQLYYLYRALGLYRAYRDWIKTQFSDTEIISFRWFRNFLIGLTVTAVLSLLMNLLSVLYGLSYWQNWWDDVATVVLIYYASITGYAQPQPTRHLLFQATANDVIPADYTLSAPVDADPTQSQSASNQLIINPELSDDYKMLYARLLTFMTTERPYLEPELSLADLARRLHTNPVALSQVINAGVGKNFNDFVNSYRVEAFKAAVSSPVNRHLSLLGIALDCGFNSKATFNRAFKKFTGLMPKEFAEKAKITEPSVVPTVA
ncbi:helix-turn-helix domain-containing protein [Fibrella aquatilis]|uniref:AraC family transcriptional regulator n=1 Tax=Fibrella aquatilis TaxID=2817059 RepID=A0A939G2Y0_9BACT|nr:helix-turn-helix domain-containing protein [Fibrella aquatilis]MBO0930110.1 AraC family transcriptional regulator [Fibrella aquatilis]